MNYYRTLSNSGSVLEFKQGNGFVSIYRDGEEWGVPQGQGFLKVLMRDLGRLKSIEDAVSSVESINDKEVTKQFYETVQGILNGTQDNKPNYYAVGVGSFEDDLEVVLTYAENDIEAVCNAVQQKYIWDMRGEKEFALVNSVQELITLALQGDVTVSPPVRI